MRYLRSSQKEKVTPLQQKFALSYFTDIDVFFWFFVFSENEDCLFLNVFVPATSSTEGKMAVMVWIHGTGLASFSSSPKFRGFSIGSSTEYPAHVLAGYNNVIVVTFNYRLGILGFLSSVPGTNKTGNYGMFDQVTSFGEEMFNYIDSRENKIRATLSSLGGTEASVLGAGEPEIRNGCNNILPPPPCSFALLIGTPHSPQCSSFRVPELQGWI